MLEFPAIDHDEEHNSHEPTGGILTKRLTGDDADGFATYRVTFADTPPLGSRREAMPGIECQIRHRDSDLWLVFLHKATTALLAKGGYTSV